ncbi:MAG: AI-2E family transporter [Clostridia bacterium]|nr:AI-2E family transporter [Clostridia bacterium]
MADNTGGAFLKHSATTIKDWVKSQVILSLITLAALLTGLYFIGVKHWILIAIGITVVDAVPFLGLGITMLPWAFYELVIDKDRETGLWLFGLFVLIMVVRQILEPFVRGKSLGISPLEEVAASVGGFVLTGFNGIGLIAGPIVYIIGKKLWQTKRAAQEPAAPELPEDRPGERPPEPLEGGPDA